MKASRIWRAQRAALFDRMSSATTTKLSAIVIRKTANTTSPKVDALAQRDLRVVDVADDALRDQQPPTSG